MKKLVLLILTSLGLAPLASADGFVCGAETKDLRLAVYHSTGPATRRAEILVVSDPTRGFGRRTIAKFSNGKGTLSNEGSAYTATVDTSVEDSARVGENIAGTKLGELLQIDLNVDFSYARPVPAGEEVSGELVLRKKNGEVILIAMNCIRYLKGQE